MLFKEWKKEATDGGKYLQIVDPLEDMHPEPIPRSPKSLTRKQTFWKCHLVNSSEDILPKEMYGWQSSLKDVQYPQFVRNIN